MSVEGLDGRKVVVACHVSCSSLQGFDPFSSLVFMSSSLMLLNANLLNLTAGSPRAQHC